MLPGLLGLFVLQQLGQHRILYLCICGVALFFDSSIQLQILNSTVKSCLEKSTKSGGIKNLGFFPLL